MPFIVRKAVFRRCWQQRFVCFLNFVGTANKVCFLNKVGLSELSQPQSAANASPGYSYQSEKQAPASLPEPER